MPELLIQFIFRMNIVAKIFPSLHYPLHPIAFSLFQSEDRASLR